MSECWTFESGSVVFVGAGPGAADLITLRGKAAIEQADLMIYADSLVHQDIASFARPDATVLGSADMTLEEICRTMIEAARRGERVARVQSGDPSLYGALHEQICRLEEAGVPYQIVPGVSSGFAAAAALGAELTVPDVSQTVIFTRLPSRTSGPPGEQLGDLPPNASTLVVFLSANVIERVVAELLEAGWDPGTPAAVVHRVTWEDELVLRGTLADIAQRSRQARLSKHALIIVGAALDASKISGADQLRSSLYHPAYSHAHRVSTGDGSRHRAARRSGAETERG